MAYAARRRRHARSVVTFAAAVLGSAPALARAADVTSRWAGAASGTWNVNTNWLNTPALGGFPNNGNAGVATYASPPTSVSAPPGPT